MLNEDRPIEMPNFLVDLSVTDNLDLLSDKQFRRVFTLMIEFAKNGEVDLSQEEPLIRSVFLPFKNTIEKGRNQYVAKVKRNRDIAKKRHKPVKDNQSSPVVTSGNQSSQIKENKTKVNETKLNKVSCKDTLFSNSTEVSQSGFPDGHPTGKPEYRELRRYARIILGKDDAYFCDDFEWAIERYDNDWSDWQERMKRFAVKQGKEINDV